MTPADEARQVRRLLTSLDRREIDRREFLILASAFSATAIVAACQPASLESSSPASGAPTSAPSVGSSAEVPSTGRKTVPFYTTESDPATLAFYASAIRGFNENFPEVDVPMNLYAEGASLQFLLTAFRTGHDVGVFSPIASFVHSWASQGHLLELDDFVTSVGEDDFLPGTRFIVNGHDYQVPFQSNTNALWYRRDLFEKAGLPEPTTYDRLLGAAQELHGKDGIVGIATGTGGAAQFALSCASPYLLQSGWGYFDRTGALTFDRPEVLEGVNRFVNLMRSTDQSFYNSGFADLLGGYISGRAAMAHYPGRMGVNLDRQAPDIADVTGVVGEPGGPFQEGQINNGSTRGYSIYSKTAAPDEALAFVEHLTTGDNALTWALTVPGHVLPPLRSITGRLQDPAESLIKDNPYLQKHSDWVAAMIAMLPATNEQTAMGAVSNLTFEPISNPNPWGDQIWGDPSLDGMMFQEILLQGKDPEQAWSETAAKFKEIGTKWLSDNPDWQPAV